MAERAEPDDEDVQTFDFDEHRRNAVEVYRTKRGLYADLARSIQSLLREAITANGLKVQTVDERAKEEDSFGAKASRPEGVEGRVSRYKNPLEEIHDLAGCRVITFFLDDVQKVRGFIETEFEVLEMANRSSYLRGGKPGYESFHFVVRMNETRLALPEYARFRGLAAEIQVRTILQHAWAEIEHDIQYKSVDSLPVEVGQRFQALAGLIEIGDREFQAISDAHAKVRNDAAISLQQGRLADVELTADSLKAYLDKEFGPDGRMRDWVYDWTASYLRRMGFQNLQQLDACISDYDDDALSRAVWGNRQGQISRFEVALLAGVGPERMKAYRPHAWSTTLPQGWYGVMIDRQAQKIEDAGFRVGNYVPGQE